MFLQMMSACSWIPWVLLFPELLPSGQASHIVECPTYRYMVNGTCYTCPENCRVCVSDNNCSLCTKGFFGPICENRCGDNCPGTCHQIFGHCTEGCPDGEYPSQYDHCIRCPPQCSLCKSKSECAMCEFGYFGETCTKKCSDYCTICNKTTGQCLQCKDSYFKLNEQCRRCQQGCGLCNSTNICSRCNDAYFLDDGLCRSCPYGCRICMTAEKCRSCEDGFQGPVHDRCLYKCPRYGVTTYNLPYEDGRCGLWQDTTTNICHLKSETQSCTSSGNCLQDIHCPDSVRCVDDTNEQASCATVMYYDCKHTCKLLVSRYGCEANCTVDARDTGDNRLLCVAGIGNIEANTLQNTTEANCKPHQVTPTDSTSWPTDRIVLTVCVTGCVITICILIALISQRTCRRGFTKWNNSKKEYSIWSALTSVHNRTQTDVLSATRPDDEQTTQPMMPRMDNVLNMSVDEGFGGSRQQSRSQSFSTSVC